MTEKGISIDSKWKRKKRIFKDKGIVKLSYIPESLNEVLHRNDVIDRLQNCLLDVSEDLAPNNILIYGMTGTGKTLISRLVLKDLKEVAQKNGIKLTILEIGCELAKTENGILNLINNKLVSELYGELKITICNSISRNNINFVHNFNQLDGILIIVLDEIDKIKDPNLINNLTRTISISTNQPPCLVLITNDIHFKENLAAHTKSVLAENEISFKPYDAEQLNDILTARIKKAFCPGVIEETVIPLISALSAQEHGDARKAMNLLCKSGEIAEEKEKDTIDEEDVRAANARLDIDVDTEIVKNLPTQSKLILYSIIKVIDIKSKSSQKECTISESYSLYRFFAHELAVDMLTQRRITDLISELEILGIITTVITSSGRYGRSKKISILRPHSSIITTILQDYRLKSLADITSLSYFKNNFA